MKILVIEDNPKMGAFICQGLTEQGYIVQTVSSGRDGEEQAVSGNYDLVVLDVMMPDQDGVLTCKNIRRRKCTTPILVLTALSTTSDKIAGLDAGADDYMTKPFEFSELAARVRALLRRGQAQEATVLRFEDIEMDLLSRKLTRGGHRIKLGAKEFALMDYFLRNPNVVLSRAMIGQHVWDMNFDNDSNVIDVYVSMLRRKMDKDFGRRLIHTVVGSGYMLSADDPEV